MEVSYNFENYIFLQLFLLFLEKNIEHISVNFRVDKIFQIKTAENRWKD